MTPTPTWSPEDQLFCQNATVWLRSYNRQTRASDGARDLGCNAAGFRLIVAESRGTSFNGYFATDEGFFFVSGWQVWSQNKPVKRITTVKPDAAPVTAHSAVFLRAGKNVLCRGKRMSKVDADTFRCIGDTRFAVDAHTLFAWDLTDGLSRLEMDTSRLTFIPLLENFCTDGERVYHQSSWTEKIESFPIDDERHAPARFGLHEIESAVNRWLFGNTPPASEQEGAQRAAQFEYLGQSFRRLFDALGQARTL